MPLDPVCGMGVPVKSHSPRHTFAGQSYYFCSKACAAKFAAQPARWAYAPRSTARAPKGARP